MIVRVVKLHVEPEFLVTAKEILKGYGPKVRSFPGCEMLEISTGIEDPGVIFTYSYWECQEDLEIYRHSEMFREFWSSIKPHFSKPALAWSLNREVFCP